MAIRLYTDEQLNQLTGGKTTPIIKAGATVADVLKKKKPTTTDKIRLYSDEQLGQFQKVDKYNKLIEESWKIEEEAQKAASLKGVFKEAIRPKSLLGAVGKIGKAIGGYGKAAITRPKEVAKGAFETAVLKPVEFAQRVLQPSVEQKPIEEIIGEPEDKEAQKARNVGEFLGWLAPYSAIAKGTQVTLKALTTAPKIVKYIPIISDIFGFVGTGQILHEDEVVVSRLKQARNDIIALGIFKLGVKGFQLLKKTTVKEVDNTIKIATNELKDLLKKTQEKTLRDIQVGRPEKIALKKLPPEEGKPIYDIEHDIRPIEQKIKQANEIIKTETGLTPKEYLQRDIKAEVKPVTPKVAPTIPKEAVIEKVIPKPIKITGKARPKEVVAPEPAIPKGKPAGVALSIEAKAIEKNLTKRFSELAEFTPTTVKQQARRMETLMKDVEKAKRVVRGTEPLPEGLSPATVIATMEEHALKTRDGELMAELAKSPLVTQISEAAQKLSLTSQREKESAVRKIKEVVTAREKGVERKLKFTKPEKIKSNIRKSLDAKIKATKPSKFSWTALIDEIKC